MYLLHCNTHFLLFVLMLFASQRVLYRHSQTYDISVTTVAEEYCWVMTWAEGRSYRIRSVLFMLGFLFKLLFVYMDSGQYVY